MTSHLDVFGMDLTFGRGRRGRRRPRHQRPAFYPTHDPSLSKWRLDPWGYPIRSDELELLYGNDDVLSRKQRKRSNRLALRQATDELSRKQRRQIKRGVRKFDRKLTHLENVAKRSQRRMDRLDLPEDDADLLEDDFGALSRGDVKWLSQMTDYGIKGQVSMPLPKHPRFQGVDPAVLAEVAPNALESMNEAQRAELGFLPLLLAPLALLAPNRKKRIKRANKQLAAGRPVKPKLLARLKRDRVKMAAKLERGMKSEKRKAKFQRFIEQIDNIIAEAEPIAPAMGYLDVLAPRIGFMVPTSWLHKQGADAAAAALTALGYTIHVQTKDDGYLLTGTGKSGRGKTVRLRADPMMLQAANEAANPRLTATKHRKGIWLSPA